MAVYRRLLQKRSFLLLACIFIICINKFSYKRYAIQSSESKLDHIPNYIWQYFDPRMTSHPLYQRLGESVQSWIINDPDFRYTLFSDAGANGFVTQHYPTQSHTHSTFFEINTPVLRADLLRYMLIESEGGYYGDVDTTLHKPIKHWIPTDYRDRARFVVGIEYDQLEDAEPSHGFKERISFAQWTFAARKGHPILTKVIEKVVNAIHSFAKEQGRTVATMEVPDQFVGRVTGPGIWTLAVFEGMSEAMGTSISWENITGITEPRLFGDILLMPVDAFGTGQPHSGASQDIVESTCVRHQWKMSWRHLNEDGSVKPGTA